MLGPTGYGKSTLARLLVPRRAYVVAFATKRKDDTMDKFEKQLEFKVQKTFRPEVSNRIILKPKIDPDDSSEQAHEFDRAMSEIFWQGGWCVCWDEAAYLNDFLGLKQKMSLLLMQGRSLGISCMTLTQRPAFIPVYAYDMPIHYFFWKLKLDRDVERVAKLGGLDISSMKGVIRSLQRYQFLYYNKDTDESFICKPDKY